jgi:hypothetical protein
VTDVNPLEPRLRQLVELSIPQPGRGDTLGRWNTLADVAAEDVGLIKLFEGHTDALAILTELSDYATPTGSLWATWAAEPPSARLELSRSASGTTVSGRKAWCSGADIVTHAVVSCWDDSGRQCLVAVDLAQPGVQITTDGWHAVGMGRVASGDVLFEQVATVEIGRPGQYTERAGFWHGGAGIGACWYGGALPLARELARSVGRSGDAHGRAHLGAVDVSLRATRALLIEAATWIDAHPVESAPLLAMQVRASAEASALLVLEHAGRALGAGPLCRDADIAQRFADLPVFLRQSHAERDLAALGKLVAERESASPSGWTLS